MGKEKINTEIASLQRMVKALESDKQAYKSASEELGEEILSLKRKIGGYKTYTNRLRNEVETEKEIAKNFLHQRDNAYDAINKFSDALANKNETIQKLESIRIKQTNTISECRNELASIKNDYQLLEERYDSVCQDRKALEDVYYGLEDYLAKPWYKRIFIKLDKLLEDAD